MSFYCEGRSEKLVPVNIANLEDIALNWAVAFSIEMTNINDFTSHFPKVRMVTYDEGGPPFLSAGWGPTHNGPPYYWEPLDNWEQLGALIDKHGMCYSYTARDHEEQRVSAFCPGFGEHGRAYGSNCKKAMLRALVSRLQESEEVEIPIDILLVSKTWIDPDVKAQYREFAVDSLPEVEPFEIDNDF